MVNPWPYILLLMSAILGGSITFLIRPSNERVLKLVLAFSGAYLFGICAVHLFGEVYTKGGQEIGLLVLLGFFIQLALEQFSKGTEHGHIHAPGSPSWTFMWSVLFGLSVHAFLEGIPLAGTFSSAQSWKALLYGITLHKMPAAFALASIAGLVTEKRVKVFLIILLFSLMSPAGMLSGSMVPGIDEATFTTILAIVLGSFLHISTTILFESGSSLHQFNLLKIIAIFAGVGVSLLTLLT